MALKLQYAPIAPEILEAAKQKASPTAKVDLADYFEALEYARMNGMAAEISGLGDETLRAHKRRFNQAAKEWESGKYRLRYLKTDSAEAIRFILEEAPTEPPKTRAKRGSKKAATAASPELVAV